MNKHYLFRKASVIHAIKCNKAEDFNIAIQSFETLERFKCRIQNAVDEKELIYLNGELDIWAGQEPIATQSEIEHLIFQR
jgi:hypothetical protein